VTEREEAVFDRCTEGNKFERQWSQDLQSDNPKENPTSHHAERIHTTFCYLVFLQNGQFGFYHQGTLQLQ